MRILNEGLSLAEEIEADGRISESQEHMMLKYAGQDPEAEVIGMDKKVRPVIRARLGGAKRASTFSLLAGGRPTEVHEPMLEEWR